MAIFQYATYFQNFQFVSGGLVLDISGAQFVAAIRKQKSDPDPPLLTMSTATGELTVIDGPNGILQMALTKPQTTKLPLGYVWSDFMRIDQTDAPRRYFGARFTIMLPVTRLP